MKLNLKSAKTLNKKAAPKSCFIFGGGKINN